MSTASTTCGSSSVVATEPVWPPPSPPCTITASTPHAATFSACRRAPIDGTTAMPASFSCLIWCSRGASANDATGTLLADQERDARVGVFGVGAQVHAERPVGARPAPRGSRPRAGRRSSSPTRGCRARPLRPSRSTSRGPATQPMPVCTIGTSMPNRSQIGVRDGHGRAAHGFGTSFFAEAERVDDLADPRAARRRSAGATRARRRRDRELEAGRGDDVVDGDARVHRAQPHPVVGRRRSRRRRDS